MLFIRMQIIFVEPFDYYSKGDIIMRIGETLFISPKFTAADFIELGLKPKSEFSKWNAAVAIFHDRISGRFLKPINRLIKKSPELFLDDNVETNGFAAMSLMCLLIDTFMQFRYGFPQAPSKQANFFYKRFMTDCLDYPDFEACNFYTNIRCALLHSAETKNGCFLVPEYKKRIDVSGLNGETKQEKAILLVSSETGHIVISVSVKGLYSELETYFKDYCAELLQGKDKKLREAFIVKMNSIVAKPDLYLRDNELWDAIYSNQRNLITCKGMYSFGYECNEKDRSLKLSIFRGTSHEEEYVSFADIKDYLYCSDNEIRSLLFNGEYIKQILELCKHEVFRYKAPLRSGNLVKDSR